MKIGDFLKEINTINDKNHYTEVKEKMAKQLSEFHFLNRFLNNKEFSIIEVMKIDDDLRIEIMKNFGNLFNVKTILFKDDN